MDITRRTFFIGGISAIAAVSAISQSGAMEYVDPTIEEYLSVRDDPVAYLKKYVPSFPMVKDVENYLTIMHRNERLNVIVGDRASGKSIAALGYVLWHINTQPHKVVAFDSFDYRKSTWVVDKISKYMQESVDPFKPTITRSNRNRMGFDNDVELFVHIDSIKGRAVSLVMLDEAKSKSKNEFLRTYYPIVASGESGKIIMISS